MQNASQAAMASRNGSGAWPNWATSATETMAPMQVPSRRNTLLASTMPLSGWLTTNTVTSAHCGCCNSKRNAR